MSDLKMLENELVPVYITDSGEKVVYGTELYACLKSRRQYTDWIKERLSECDATENEDFESFSQKNEKGGRPKTEYIIKLNTAKEMAMLERNEVGKNVRKYFIQVEEKYKENLFDGISTELRAVLVVDKRVTAVERKVDHLENTMNIDYAQQKQLKNFANEIVVSALGGKEARAYRYKAEDGTKISSQCFSRFWHDFNDYFNINAYANLPRVRFNEALQYINRWQPPTNMQLEIGRINREIA